MNTGVQKKRFFFAYDGFAGVGCETQYIGMGFKFCVFYKSLYAENSYRCCARYKQKN